MKALLNWAITNPITFVVTVVIVISVAVLVYKSRKGLICKAALYAVSKAEEEWGSKTGRIKFAEAYTYISKQYPIITFFFTEKQLTDIIENALVEMKKILASKQGKENKTETTE